MSRVWTDCFPYEPVGAGATNAGWIASLGDPGDGKQWIFGLVRCPPGGADFPKTYTATVFGVWVMTLTNVWQLTTPGQPVKNIPIGDTVHFDAWSGSPPPASAGYYLTALATTSHDVTKALIMSKLSDAGWTFPTVDGQPRVWASGEPIPSWDPPMSVAPSAPPVASSVDAATSKMLTYALIGGGIVAAAGVAYYGHRRGWFHRWGF